MNAPQQCDSAGRRTWCLEAAARNLGLEGPARDEALGLLHIPCPTAPEGALLTCPKKLSQPSGPWMRGEGRISLASFPMFPLALNSTQRLSTLFSVPTPLATHPQACLPGPRLRKSY